MTTVLHGLLAPSANRVYGQQAAALAAAELRFVLAHTVPGALEDVREESIAGMPTLRIELADWALDADIGGAAGEGIDAAARARVLTALARSPHIFGVFDEVGTMPAPEPVGPDREAAGPAVGPADGAAGEERLYVDEMPELPLLLPVRTPAVDRFDSTLLTTLKYQGKTNEQFTALMLSCAIAASADAHLIEDTSRPFTVLDPVAGRGTTLNQALMWGLDAVGVDLDKKDAELFRAFLTTWMRENRLKHTTSAERLTVNGQQLGSVFRADLARSKEEQRAGRGQSLTLFTADTTGLGAFIRPRSANAIVADLPYGVQHGARAQAGKQTRPPKAGKQTKNAALSRSPLQLVESALPAWSRAMTDGASLVLAVNRRTAPYPAMAEVLQQGGLRLLTEDGQFRHRVDRSIDRDIIVAVKRSHPASSTKGTPS